MAAAKHIEGTNLHFQVLASTKLGMLYNVEDDSTSEFESDHEGLTPLERLPSELQTLVPGPCA